ncbi:SBF-like CPA transporter family-domain-containing protein [Mycotypha africana]|uniref:SBF-like CPA transporter family-domain-containing protein n=1 Tax=Mycotypha africana TaxID=64632 RepID=UPI00230026EA|nr:SBF-like CPA transporter family-domain-containing protein [Mycotypha africana]KAI8979549.1 SBF-like CPA transporter family-domain-containing protein [Mycotypha africana]
MSLVTHTVSKDILSAPAEQQQIENEEKSNGSIDNTELGLDTSQQSYNIKKRQQQSNKRRQFVRILLELFKKYYFLVGLGISIGIAWAAPQLGMAHGLIQAQYTIKWGAVIIIFLLSGLGLDVGVMWKTILRWRLHLTVQLINFILLPFVMYGIVRFFISVHANLDMSVYKGWMIALSTSTTVSSNSVMTRSANGNDAAGNLLGIFVSPALMTAFQNDPIVFEPGTDRGNPDYINVLKTLGCTVLAPLVVGQVIRYFFPTKVKYLAARCKFSIINTLALLLLIFSTFCDGVASDAFHKLSGVDIVAIIFVDIFMYLFGCAVSLFIARLPWPSNYSDTPKWVKKLRFPKKDAIAIMYCGATKTVSMGIPLINVLYSESSYGVVGVLSLPLLMYHICQLFIGNIQVSFLKRWADNNPDENDVSNNTNIPIERAIETIPISIVRHRGNQQVLS